MAQIERQQPALRSEEKTRRAVTVLNILQNLRDLDGLKKLFWEELNYERENKPLSPRQWPDSAKQPLADDPTLFAAGGEDNAFHVVYCRLSSSDLKRGLERPVVNQLLREHPYCLFIFSNKGQSVWHFLNLKYDEAVEKRRLVRRITVWAGEGLRTAAERIQMLDLATIQQKSPLVIQSRCDEAFDVEKVSKDFYREVANWYFWALKHVEFPKDAPKEKDGRDHISVIRLITRLIFCWFIREKGLIQDVLFDERRLADMLEGFAPDKSRNRDSVFYRAILQNLFFATLNTEMDQRGWRREEQNFMAHSLYRHKACFREPKAALEWFKNIPFLNGGLFECLDKDFGENVKPRYLRIDGFSDRPDSQPTVPDFLFFGPEQEVDLSEDYGDKKFRKVRVRGLIDTLNRYKFTIEENTPFDQEVALDPELCGKVFENLLAAYNPETGTTARKATGSFYTPREIVDYMVDESLVAYLKGKIETTKHANDAKLEDRLRGLISWEGADHGFSEAETETLIDAIDHLKALDPAVGSGAFPMGILHKLVHVLGKLDPDNERWKAKQIAKLDDAVMREEAERVFRDNYDNYGRKLYLIENCIYGVDIQPIAVQIAKMRFFISLIVDQKVNPAAPNLGVRALPNLETKFVAANTLIGIERKERQGDFLTEDTAAHQKLKILRDLLTDVRHRHFTARTNATKAKCRQQDREFRTEMSGFLEKAGVSASMSRQLVAWDPYDQNASAGFFDAEWMFGVREGFDVVIGNPPYVLIGKQEFVRTYGGHFPLLSGKPDLYRMFIERGLCLPRSGGFVCFIVPNTLLAIPSAAKLRKYATENTRIRLLLDLTSPVFGTTAVNNIILLAGMEKPNGNAVCVGIADTEHGIEALTKLSQVPQLSWLQNRKCEWRLHVSGRTADLVSKLVGTGLRLQTTTEDICLGMQVYHNTIHTQAQMNARYLHSDTKRGRLSLPEFSGRHISGFRVGTEGPVPYVDYSADAIYLKPDLRFFRGPRLILREIVGDRLVLAYADLEFAVNKSCYILRSEHLTDRDMKAILAILHSRCVAFWVHLCGDKAKQALFPRITMNTLKAIPIPRGWKSQRETLANLVDRILAAKKADPAADVSAWEREIDERVYKLYGLTEDEVKLVEESAK